MSTTPDGGARRGRGGNPLVVVAVLVLALAAYFALIGYRGVYLLDESAWRLKVLGVAVLALPLVGIWVVVAEIRFGLATQRLAERMRADGRSVESPELPRTPSGRIVRAAADAWFDQRRADVEGEPGDWHAWYRLAQAYDLSGDRKRAREAMRTAIEKAG